MDSTTCSPSIESLIGLQTVGQARSVRQRDIRAGRPCLSVDDAGVLRPIAKCPRRTPWLPAWPSLVPLRRKLRGGLSAAKPLQRVCGAALRLVAGAMIGGAVAIAAVVVVVGASHLANVRWGVIAAALQGDLPPLVAKPGQNEAAAHKHIGAMQDPVVAHPVSPSPPPATQAATSVHPGLDPSFEANALDRIPLPPLPQALTDVGINPTGAAIHAGHRASPRFAPAKLAVSEPPPSPSQPDAGVSVHLLPGPAHQPSILSRPQGGVSVALLQAAAPESSPATSTQAHPAPAVEPDAWSVITVIADAVVLREGSRMITIPLGSQLPDGRVLRSVDPSRGTWAAAYPAPTPQSSQPHQEHSHGSPSTLHAAIQAQPGGSGSAAR